jgi:excisionase family DNA binding protein
MTNSSPSAIVGTDEAARILEVERSTVTRWAQAGTLTPAYKMTGLRGAYVFARADIDALKAERAS